jgi:hypothetical protein
MTELHPARLTLLLFAVAFGTLFAIACSGGEKETANTNPGSNAPTGFSATVYASPT